MKSIRCISLIIIAVSFSISAQNGPDKIMGTWLNAKKNARIKIYQEQGRYYGKVIWFTIPQNDDESSGDLPAPADSTELKKKLLGQTILSDLHYENGKWIDGSLYLVKKDTRVDCTIELSRGGNELYITISKWGIERTVTWTRVS